LNLDQYAEASKLHFFKKWRDIPNMLPERVQLGAEIIEKSVLYHDHYIQ
jgi:hypothetical protein